MAQPSVCLRNLMYLFKSHNLTKGLHADKLMNMAQDLFSMKPLRV